MKNAGVIFTGMGFELVGLILGGMYIGDIIDKHMGWDGYALTGLIFICLIGWIVHIVMLLQRYQKLSQGPNSDD